jgi:hypothetical protein
MTDYFLKAADATALYDVLEAAGVVTEGDQGWHVTDGHKYALDVIGDVYKPTGETIQTDEGQLSWVQNVGGFHANLRVIDASSFDADKIAAIVIDSPNNPVRAWA